MALLEPLAKASVVFAVVFVGSGGGMLLVTVGCPVIVNMSCDFVIVDTGLGVCAPEMLVTAGMVQDVWAGADGLRFCVAFDTRKALS